MKFHRRWTENEYERKRPCARVWRRAAAPAACAALIAVLLVAAWLSGLLPMRNEAPPHEEAKENDEDTIVRNWRSVDRAAGSVQQSLDEHEEGGASPQEPPEDRKPNRAADALSMQHDKPPLRDFDYTYKKSKPRSLSSIHAETVSTRKRGGIEGRMEERKLLLKERGTDVERAAREWTEELNRQISKGHTDLSPDYEHYWHMENPALVVLAYNRPDYLRTTLESLEKVKGVTRFALYVSQDGDVPEVTKVIAEHPLFARLSNKRPNSAQPLSATSYIAHHYGFVFETLFIERRHSHLIVVEDDMIFAPDFAFYFEQLAVLLDQDPSIWCISSWNDNGFKHVAQDSTRLFRTNYFPGLGWMLKSELWFELRETWPEDHWDHWMRHSGVSRERECIAPEVSRNYNIGELGSNLGKEQFTRYFKRMRLNDQVVLFSSLDHLLQDNYRRNVQELFDKAEIVKSTRVEEDQRGKVLLLPYIRENFDSIISPLAMWNTPRGMHNHTLILQYKGNTLIFADRRHCNYLPEDLRVYPHEQLQVRISFAGEDCHTPCSREGMKCHQADFEFLNNCTALQHRFSCPERGCDIAIGPETPAFTSEGLDNNPSSGADAGRCLVSEAFATCSAKRKGWVRLCPCIPRTASTIIRT